MAFVQARGAFNEEEDEETMKRNRELELNSAFLGFLGCKQDGGKAAEKTPPKVEFKTESVSQLECEFKTESEFQALATSRETKVKTRLARIEEEETEATTMAPGSSPSMAPSEADSTSELDDHLGDPVSRVSSPFHKARRLADTDDFTATMHAITMHDTKPQLTSQQAGEIASLNALALMAKHDIGVMQETPPTTPRVTALVAPDLPRTPAPKKPAFRLPPTPCRARTKIPQPSLLRALQLKSMEQVLAILQHDPEAPRELFWDHDVEPPLCAAVRLECSADIIRLLLEHGADPHVKNARGYTPARMLQELSSPVNSEPTPTPPLVAAPFVPDGLDTWPGLFAPQMGFQMGFLAPQRVEIAPWSPNADEWGVQEVVDANVANAMVWRHEVASLIKMHGGMAA
jgi:hypothetical protein